MTNLGETDRDDAFTIRLRNWTRYVVRFERVFSIVMLCLILIAMGAQVFARYVLQQPFSWSEELSRFSMIWMSFIAASFIMAEGNHISVDFWSSRVTARTSRVFTLASHLVVAISCLMLLIGGLNFVMKVHPVGSATLGIPKSYWYGAVAVGLLLMAGHSLVNFWLVLRTGNPYQAEHPDLPEGMEPQPANENVQTGKSEVAS